MAADKAIALVEPDPFIAQGDLMEDYVPSARARAGGTGMVGDSPAYVGADAVGRRDERFGELLAVARPFHGTVPKANTTAFIQIVNAKGTVIKVLNRLGKSLREYFSGDVQGGVDEMARRAGLSQGDGSTDYDDGRIFHEKIAGGGGDKLRGTGLKKAAWTDWILQQVKETRVEKTQLIETFGDSYLYVFGERPRTLSFQGLLLNTEDYNWRAQFWENWDLYFRATRLVEMNARMYISWDDILVEGYPISANAQESADSPNAMVFTFNFYVTNYTNIAAKGGFEAMKRRKQATMRSGVNSYKGSGKRVINDYWNKWSILDMLGSKGITLATAGVQKAVQMAASAYTTGRTYLNFDDPAGPIAVTVEDEMDKDAQVAHSLLNPLATAAAVGAGKLAVYGAMGYMMNEAALDSMLDAYTFDMAKKANDMVFKQGLVGLVEGYGIGQANADITNHSGVGLDGPGSLLRPGEINHWFGQAGAMASRFTNQGRIKRNKEWDANSNKSFVDAEGAMGAGTLDQISNAMAFAMAYDSESGQGRYSSAATIAANKAKSLSGFQNPQHVAYGSKTPVAGVATPVDISGFGGMADISGQGGTTEDTDENTAFDVLPD